MANSLPSRPPRRSRVQGGCRQGALRDAGGPQGRRGERRGRLYLDHSPAGGPVAATRASETYGKTDTNHKWVPCYDWPNDKCTSETHTTVPADWTVIGNGTGPSPVTPTPRTAEDVSLGDGAAPRPTYLLSLAGGHIDVKSQWPGMPLMYAAPKGMGSLPVYTLGDTRTCSRSFRSASATSSPGRSTPRARRDFAGGMENVCATTLGTRRA